LTLDSDVVANWPLVMSASCACFAVTSSGSTRRKSKIACITSGVDWFAGGSGVSRTADAGVQATPPFLASLELAFLTLDSDVVANWPLVMSASCACFAVTSSGSTRRKSKIACITSGVDWFAGGSRVSRTADAGVQATPPCRTDLMTASAVTSGIAVDGVGGDGGSGLAGGEVPMSTPPAVSTSVVLSASAATSATSAAASASDSWILFARSSLCSLKLSLLLNLKPSAPKSTPCLTLLGLRRLYGPTMFTVSSAAVCSAVLGGAVHVSSTFTSSTTAERGVRSKASVGWRYMASTAASAAASAICTVTGCSTVTSALISAATAALAAAAAAAVRP